LNQQKKNLVFTDCQQGLNEGHGHKKIGTPFKIGLIDLLPDGGFICSGLFMQGGSWFHGSLLSKVRIVIYYADDQFLRV